MPLTCLYCEEPIFNEDIRVATMGGHMHPECEQKFHKELEANNFLVIALQESDGIITCHHLEMGELHPQKIAEAIYSSMGNVPDQLVVVIDDEVQEHWKLGDEYTLEDLE